MRVDWPNHMPEQWRHAMAARSLSAAMDHFEEGKAALDKAAGGNNAASLATLRALPHVALTAAVLATLAVAKETAAQSERHWAARCRALEDRIAALEGRKP